MLVYEERLEKDLTSALQLSYLLQERRAINKHQEELLLELNAYQWETFNGDGRSDNHREDHKITLEPEGLSYLTLLESEIATNKDISSECKILLIKFVAFYFDRLNTWAASARGRKKGIFGNLSLGYIMHTQDDKVSVDLQLFRMIKEQNINIFRLDINGSGFESFNGFLFIYDDDRIYHLTDDRVSELQEK